RRHDDPDDRWRDRYRDDDRRANERDPRRWEGGRGSEVGYDNREGGGRSTERYGQGQSSYSAGRHGGDRVQGLQNRNDMVPSAGSFEDRHRDLGVDDRFTGRGGRGGNWPDRGVFGPDHYPTRGAHDSARGFSSRDDSDRGVPRGARSYEERNQ